MRCKDFLICSIHRYWIFDLVFLYIFCDVAICSPAQVTPIFLWLSSDQGNLCDNGVIVVFDQKFFFYVQGNMQICTHCSILFNLSTWTGLTRNFISRSSFFGVNTRRLCNSTWLSTAGVIFIDRLFCDTGYSGGGLRTTCFVSGIFFPFAFICLHYVKASLKFKLLKN